jgi:hypothetical protein
MNWFRALGLLLVIVAGIDGAAARDLSGRVFDATTGIAIPGATLTVEGHAVATDEAGEFQIQGVGDILQVRAPGYTRQEIETGTIMGDAAEIGLIAFAPKALYLSFYGIGYGPLRRGALALIHDTPLNALVIDLKVDRGMIPYRSAIPLAAEVGAQKIIMIKDMPALLQSLHDEGIYAIARIVVFKDDLLGLARPDLAIKTSDGGVFLDRDGLRWVDPTSSEVRDYNISIAEEAAKAGFDEIQFDYIRFPDSRRVRFGSLDAEETRTQAISDFLDAARERLTPYNVFLAADIFGYVCWNLDDTKIGQKLEEILPRVDYISPMLYPSGFQYGIPGYRNPVANSYEIVKRTMDNVIERTQVSPLRLRPWLQAFKDYAFDGRKFDADEVRDQIRAAEDFGSNGWMLWNPRNVYSDPGLEPETTAAAGSDSAGPQ